jgi:hypothetical protein
VVARETDPENPLRLVRVRVAVPGEPDCIVMLDELLEMLKSGVITTLTVTLVVWVRDPLVPVTVTVKVPVVDDETVRVEEPDPPEERETLVGLREAVKPEGETVEESDTVPMNPPWLVRLMTEAPDVPDWMVREDGLLDMLKFVVGGLTDTSCDEVPVSPFESVTVSWTV